jgi:hypothetical protein
MELMFIPIIEERQEDVKVVSKENSGKLWCINNLIYNNINLIISTVYLFAYIKSILQI